MWLQIKDKRNNGHHDKRETNEKKKIIKRQTNHGTGIVSNTAPRLLVSVCCRDVGPKLLIAPKHNAAQSALPELGAKSVLLLGT